MMIIMQIISSEFHTKENFQNERNEHLQNFCYKFMINWYKYNMQTMSSIWMKWHDYDL
jgi:hypothetical protein